MNDGSGSRRHLWRYRVDVEAEVNSGCSVGSNFNGATDYVRHAQFIDDVDREYGYSGPFHASGFSRIDLSATDLHTVLYFYISWRLSVIHHALRTPSTHCGERHAVHVPADGGFFVVPISVGINPDDTDAALVLISLAHRGNASCSDAVISPQRYREAALRQGGTDLVVELVINIDNLFVIPEGVLSLSMEQGKDVPLVSDVKTHSLQIVDQTRIPNGGRSHGNASLGGTKIHLYTDYINCFIHRKLLSE